MGFLEVLRRRRTVRRSTGQPPPIEEREPVGGTTVNHRHPGPAPQNAAGPEPRRRSTQDVVRPAHP